MSIRAQYEQHGVSGYYSEFSATYENPHQEFVRMLLNRVRDSRWQTGIDFSCGAGLVTQTWRSIDFVGVDPFMAERYEAETGRPCLVGSAEDVVNGKIKLPVSDVIVCSYAMDLIPKSYMMALGWLFAEAAENLVVLRPNKKILEHPAWNPLFHDRCDKAHLVAYKKAG